ncbi:MAG: signal peptidase I [Oscillatoriaceae cyanobacterium Prado104]|nr:signal peptidase I [Oscillatoriaceae cyanobacterium Prado104]
MSNQPNQPQKKSDMAIELCKTIGLSLFFAFGIRTAVAQSFYIASGSMQPTLEIDDRLIVDKLSYHFQDPQRGDIVVFTAPESAVTACGLPPNSRDPFIKRAIGLPGDRVEVKSGKIYVNGEQLQESYPARSPLYNWGPATVPPNSYLMLGDNRNQSCDGHFWGFVTRDRIIGKAIVRSWPLDRLGDPNANLK